MIRVLQFAGCINRYDFIDNIVNHVDPQRFSVGVAIGSDQCNIEAPLFPEDLPRWVVPWKRRREVVAPGAAASQHLA